MDFKKKFSVQQRSDECKRILKKFPDRVPIIVEKIQGSDIPNLSKTRFLVPRGLTVGQ